MEVQHQLQLQRLPWAISGKKWRLTWSDCCFEDSSGWWKHHRGQSKFRGSHSSHGGNHLSRETKVEGWKAETLCIILDLGGGVWDDVQPCLSSNSLCSSVRPYLLPLPLEYWDGSHMYGFYINHKGRRNNSKRLLSGRKKQETAHRKEKAFLNRLFQRQNSIEKKEDMKNPRENQSSKGKGSDIEFT